MSNELHTILANAIRTGCMTVLRCAVQRDSSLALKSFTYSYTYEYGSDGCWDRTETATTSVRDFLRNGISTHSNRSYNFRLDSVA